MRSSTSPHAKRPHRQHSTASDGPLLPTNRHTILNQVHLLPVYFTRTNGETWTGPMSFFRIDTLHLHDCSRFSTVVRSIRFFFGGFIFLFIYSLFYSGALYDFGVVRRLICVGEFFSAGRKLIGSERNTFPFGSC